MFELQTKPCPRDAVDAVLALLDSMGALSVSLMDDQDNPILEPLPGETPWWDCMQLNALFGELSAALIAQAQLITTYPHMTHTIASVPESDWERVCLDQFVPQRFGDRLWVCPSWTPPPEPQAVNIILDPGLAFGTGTHPTTALCLKWLDHTPLMHHTLIDYGCGSGILSIAALKLGARTVFAVDIDAQALEATQTNATRNAIHPHQLSISKPELLIESVDVIIANILQGPLITLCSRFHQLLNRQGRLVVSGVLTTQVAELIEAYKTNFKHLTTDTEAEWSLVTFQALDH